MPPFCINSEQSTATYISRILFSRGQVQLPTQLVYIDDNNDDDDDDDDSVGCCNLG
jgi:hypothetical protein